MDEQKHTNLTGKRNHELPPVVTDGYAFTAYPENSVLHAESPRGCRTFEGGNEELKMSEFLESIQGVLADEVEEIATSHARDGELFGVEVEGREATMHWEDGMRRRVFLKHIANEIFEECEPIDSVVHRVPVNADRGWVIKYHRDGTYQQLWDIKPLPLFKVHGVLV